MLSKARINELAEQCKFRVMDVEPSGVGKSVHVNLKDDKTDAKATIAIWPESTEDDLLYLLTRASFELRGMGAMSGGSHEWMM